MYECWTGRSRSRMLVPSRCSRAQLQTRAEPRYRVSGCRARFLLETANTDDNPLKAARLPSRRLLSPFVKGEFIRSERK